MRVIAFEVEIDGRVVYAQVTCEAVLRKLPEEIERALQANMKLAIETLTKDAHHNTAQTVLEQFRARKPGDSAGDDAGNPIFLNSFDL